MGKENEEDEYKDVREWTESSPGGLALLSGIRGLETSAGGKFIFFAMPDNGQRPHPHTWGSLVASQWWERKELVTQ